MNRSTIVRAARHAIFIAWAAPWSLVGLLLGAAALASGGSAQRRDGILEFYGGCLPWLMSRIPVDPLAMTLGHVVVARDECSLDCCRAHERVHVAQYERWGALFVPAYALASLWAWWRGKDPYRDNVFEVAAYREAP